MRNVVILWLNPMYVFFRCTICEAAMCRSSSCFMAMLWWTLLTLIVITMTDMTYQPLFVIVLISGSYLLCALCLHSLSQKTNSLIWDVDSNTSVGYFTYLGCWFEFKCWILHMVNFINLGYHFNKIIQQYLLSNEEGEPWASYS